MKRSHLMFILAAIFAAPHTSNLVALLCAAQTLAAGIVFTRVDTKFPINNDTTK